MSAMPSLLLAKSVRRGASLSLAQHSIDTEQAATLLFDPDHRWGQAWLRFFQIADQPDRFRLNLRLAALFHDLGKANEEFQRAVSERPSPPQTLRHEHLSALILHLEGVRTWLASNPEVDVDAITAAVLSHHLKAAPPTHGTKWAWCIPQTPQKQVVTFLSHQEVRSVLTRASQLAKLSGTPSLPPTPWGGATEWAGAFSSGMTASRELFDSCHQDRDCRRFVGALKAGVIVADAAASGLVREGHPIDRWICDVSRSSPLASGEIEEKIIAPRVAALARRARRPFTWHRFQSGAADQGRRTLLLAGCGAGKTLAAWRWAAAQSDHQKLGRVIFLYPTRGTATEGFRDYVGWAPESEAALLHATSRYELEGMQRNPSDATSGKRHLLTESEERLFALGLWNKRYFSATVDQFLSFLEHRYSAVCLLPALADSALIIDEIHSFDRCMFDSLVNFLREFDLPVLCMTATLSSDRRKELVDAGLTIYPAEDQRSELRDLERLERHPRYAVQLDTTKREAAQRAVAAFRDGKRVLWVVNTVARCQALAAELNASTGEAICYHSRFKLSDRQRQHGRAVAAFQQHDVPAIAVTTQVCEMSLDLDADVLISETAPLSSLIQRFGRANRHLRRGDDFRADVLVYRPEKPAPYDEAELTAATAALEDLGSGKVSQADLSAALEKHGRSEATADSYARFLDSGYFATAGEFRDSDDFTRPCVLESDIEAVRAVLQRQQPIDGWIVNVPRNAELGTDDRPDWLPKHVGIAPGGARYCSELGFLDKDLAASQVSV